MDISLIPVSCVHQTGSSSYIHGVSTRKVDELVQALGMTGISKSQVSRLCSELDEMVEEFRNRPLSSRYPYLWLDAKYIKSVRAAEFSAWPWSWRWESPRPASVRSSALTWD